MSCFHLPKDNCSSYSLLACVKLYIPKLSHALNILLVTASPSTFSKRPSIKVNMVLLFWGILHGKCSVPLVDIVFTPEKSTSSSLGGMSPLCLCIIGVFSLGGVKHLPQNSTCYLCGWYI